MRQSSIVLLAAFVSISLAVTVHRRDDSSSIWDPTTRDWTQKCTDLAKYSGEHFCAVFEVCCTNDPLNGDKCQNQDRACVYDNEARQVSEARCLLSNCTAMITTTPPPTTPNPYSKQSSGLYPLLAWVGSVFLLLI